VNRLTRRIFSPLAWQRRIFRALPKNRYPMLDRIAPVAEEMKPAPLERFLNHVARTFGAGKIQRAPPTSRPNNKTPAATIQVGTGRDSHSGAVSMEATFPTTDAAFSTELIGREAR